MIRGVAWLFSVGLTTTNERNTHESEQGDEINLVVIFMAKAPVAGQVKTRLVGGGVTAEATARISDAFTRCTIDRVTSALDDRPTRFILAVAPDDQVPILAERFAVPNLEVVGQGSGDLGERMARVWRYASSRNDPHFHHLPSNRPDGGSRASPVMVLGVDTPDVPTDWIVEAASSLCVFKSAHASPCDLVIGPAADGGYWTIGGRRPIPDILEGITWGSAKVFEQTQVRAAQQGLRVHVLAPWSDVDDQGDLSALRARLATPDSRLDAALEALRNEVEVILCDTA